ncbi:hypothetical protein GCM10023185_18530 [Hymenobacter saemangeumensis]|uniref:Uncharacterized protein n=1 Tax=Hymenobacter saemangeumensis TaxID=1084522 RepID=A0ABP8IBP4_9BACT
MQTSFRTFLVLSVLIVIFSGFITRQLLSVESRKFVAAQLASRELKPTEKKNQYLKYDYAPLWLHTPHEAVVGFIGADYQRLQMKFLTAVKDPAQPDTYRVSGKSKVANSICAFTGTIIVRHVRERRSLPLPVDARVSPAREAGLLLAEYQLSEITTQPKTGVFSGILLTRWFLDKTGRLHYDDLEKYADGYSNNQFVGTWTPHIGTKVLRCNWGDYRIPNAGDFDMGAGEFSPNEKYRAKGWHTYTQAWMQQDKAAQQRESQRWW